MTGYLARLKVLDSGKHATKALQKLQKAPAEFPETATLGTAKTAKSPFYSFCSSDDGHFRKIDAVQALAADIANQHGTTAEFCLSMLDGGDIHAIETGSDPGRTAAWRCAVGLAVQRGDAPKVRP